MTAAPRLVTIDENDELDLTGIAEPGSRFKVTTFPDGRIQLDPVPAPVETTGRVPSAPEGPLTP